MNDMEGEANLREDVVWLTTQLDCGDSSCRFAQSRKGMRTNGGCRCIESRVPFVVARIARLLRSLPALLRELDDLRAQCKDPQKDGRTGP